MALNIERELQASGCTLERTAFYDLVQDTRAVLFPSWSDDELACHPRDALQFCEAVRGRTRAPGIPDHIIMHSLFNARKH